MNLERESDRQLRAWAAQGIDRAPEQVVWGALDAIEQIPQRTARAKRFDDLASRLRRPTAFAAAAAALLVAITILPRALGPDLGSGSTRAFVMADLQDIVLWEDTKPRDWILDNLVSNPHDIIEIPIRSMTQVEMDRLPLPAGYLGGRYTNFSGSGLFMSWAALFEGDAAAAAALPFFQRELGSAEGWDFGPGEPTALGDEGWMYSGVTRAFTLPRGFDLVPGHVYLWRNGNLLLAVGGWFEFDPDEVRAAAEGMDRRADAAATMTEELP